MNFVTIIVVATSFIFALTCMCAAQRIPVETENVIATMPADTLSRSHDLALQDDTPEWHSMVTNLPGDWARSAEMVFQSSSIPVIAGVAVLTGGLIVSDKETYRGSKSLCEQSSFVQSASDFAVGMGDGKVHLGVAAGFALFGFAAHDSRALRTASQIAEVLLATGLVVQVMKRITGRESPEAATTEGGRWRFFPNQKQYNKHQARYYAFPSGHTATTMATVTIIAENYPEIGWIRPVGYSLVGLVGVGLVNVGFHWYSDLPLGLALGYLFGMAVSHPDGADITESGSDDAMSVAVTPTVNPNGVGLLMSISF